MGSVRSPYRRTTPNGKVLNALLHARAPMTVLEIARHSKITIRKASDVLIDLLNPLVDSLARRSGLSVERVGDGFVVRRTRWKPPKMRGGRKPRSR